MILSLRQTTKAHVVLFAHKFAARSPAVARIFPVKLLGLGAQRRLLFAEEPNGRSSLGHVEIMGQRLRAIAQNDVTPSNAGDANVLFAGAYLIAVRRNDLSRQHKPDHIAVHIWVPAHNVPSRKGPVRVFGERLALGAPAYLQ